MSPLREAKTLVVKVGSSLVTAAGRGLDAAAIALWAEQIARLMREGRRVILVSSGAIAEGMQRLGWTRRPQTMHELQAAAAADQVGLFDSDPRTNTGAKLVEEADALDARLEAMAGGTGSALAKGGMLTKVQAARRAARSGAHTVIADGREREVLVRLAAGERIGSLLTAKTVPLAARKQWLADHLAVAAKLKLDAGAARALQRDGKSLLPIGVVEVSGEFERGAVVACLDPDGREVARGLGNYSAAAGRRIMRKPSSAIASILGYMDEPELIHRDNLVLL